MQNNDDNNNTNKKKNASGIFIMWLNEMFNVPGGDFSPEHTS